MEKCVQKKKNKTEMKEIEYYAICMYIKYSISFYFVGAFRFQPINWNLRKSDA